MIKFAWNYARTIFFYLIGILNTLFIKPEEIGTWKNYLGYAILIVAVVDTIFLVKNIVKHKRRG